MKRVLILGCAGAGKSTLAKRIAAKTGLPLVHLDQHYWRAGWREPEKADWAERVSLLLRQPSWIMDGNYSQTLPQRLPAADAIILLDFPRWLCLTRVLWRSLYGFGRTRGDMAPGCPERIDWNFLKYVWNHKHRSRPRTLDLLARFPGDVIVLRDSRAVNAFVAGLRQVPAPARVNA